MLSIGEYNCETGKSYFGSLLVVPGTFKGMISPTPLACSSPVAVPEPVAAPSDFSPLFADDKCGNCATVHDGPGCSNAVCSAKVCEYATCGSSCLDCCKEGYNWTQGCVDTVTMNFHARDACAPCRTSRPTASPTVTQSPSSGPSLSSSPSSTPRPTLSPTFSSSPTEFNLPPCGNCDINHGSPGCSNTECAAQVCAENSREALCCQPGGGGWSWICADTALASTRKKRPACAMCNPYGPNNSAMGGTVLPHLFTIVFLSIGWALF